MMLTPEQEIRMSAIGLVFHFYEGEIDTFDMSEYLAEAKAVADFITSGNVELPEEE